MTGVWPVMQRRDFFKLGGAVAIGTLVTPSQALAEEQVRRWPIEDIWTRLGFKPWSDDQRIGRTTRMLVNALSHFGGNTDGPYQPIIVVGADSVLKYQMIFEFQRMLAQLKLSAHHLGLRRTSADGFSCQPYGKHPGDGKVYTALFKTCYTPSIRGWNAQIFVDHQVFKQGPGMLCWDIDLRSVPWTEASVTGCRFATLPRFI